MGNYKLYCKKVNGNEKGLVYLYLYNLPSGTKIPILHSLKIKIPRNYLIFEHNSNYAFKRVKKDLPKEFLKNTGFDNVGTLNAYIQERFENFIKIDGKKEFIEKENKTLNHWFRILIGGMYNQGTILRYTNVLNLLEMFQLEMKSTKTIYLKDLNSDFIFSFRNWLLTEPKEGQKRKRNTLNSTNYKLKCLKSVLNKCQLNNYYNFIVKPFDHIKFKELHFPIEVLNFDELQKLIHTELVEVYRRTVPTKEGVMLWGKPIEGGAEERNKKNKRYRYKHSLDDIRSYFLFQLFAQGIRVSDMITLKWGHFKQSDNNSLRIVKVMMKTKETIRILANNNMLSLLTPQIKRYQSELNNLEFNKIENINIEIENVNRIIKKRSYLSVKTKHKMWEFIEDQYKHILCNPENTGTEKIDNTQFDVYYISKEQLDEVYNMMISLNTFEEFKRRENLEEINNLFEEFDLKINDPSTTDYIIEDQQRKKLRLGRLIKKQFLSLLFREFDLFTKSKNQKNIEFINNLYDKRNSSLTNLITLLSNHKLYKNEFVFPLLNHNDFLDIQQDDYSRMNSIQYRKFQSVRKYYNGLLKIISDQCSLNKNLSSHTARHTFTSLMLELIDNVSPYDIMNSLGHKHISTTQIYMRRFSDKNVDRLNLMVPNVLGYI